MVEAGDKTPRRIPVMSKVLKLTGDGSEGVLLGVMCQNCGEYILGMPSFCPKCMSSDLKAVELGKHGILRTFTVIWAPPPGWQGPVPYILGAVELPEGPDILSEVVDCPREALKVGMSMELTVRVGGKDKEGNEIMVYKWRPSTQ
jgi:hypothetical protein